MAETLRGNFTFLMTTALGAVSTTITKTLTAESHNKALRRVIVIPAATADFAIPLADFASITMIAMIGSAAFTYRRDLTQNALPCARFAIETPGVDVNNLYITTGVNPVTLELLVVGD